MRSLIQRSSAVLISLLAIATSVGAQAPAANPPPSVVSSSVEERVFMGRRIRDVAQAADGAIFVIVDDKSGDLLRLTPAPRPR